MRVADNPEARPKRSVEASLMMPWLAFLFVGILDFGFYSYSAISIQNAARAAALRTANSQFSFSTATACIAALGELRGLPNMIGVNTAQLQPARLRMRRPAAVVVTALDTPRLRRVPTAA